MKNLSLVVFAIVFAGCGQTEETWYLQVAEAKFLEDDEQPTVCLVESDAADTSSECTPFVPGQPTLRTELVPSGEQRVQLRTEMGAVLVLPIGETPTEGVLDAEEDGRTLVVELARDELSNEYTY